MGSKKGVNLSTLRFPAIIIATFEDRRYSLPFNTIDATYDRKDDFGEKPGIRDLRVMNVVK